MWLSRLKPVHGVDNGQPAFRRESHPRQYMGPYYRVTPDPKTSARTSDSAWKTSEAF